MVVLTRKRDASIDCDYVVVSRNCYRSILAESAQHQRCNYFNGVSARQSVIGGPRGLLHFETSINSYALAEWWSLVQSAS